MSKFKKGDEVILNNDTLTHAEGSCGTVTKLCRASDSEYSGYVGVDFESDLGRHNATSIVCQDFLELLNSSTSTKVKSDGGSSSYYELNITNKNGESIKCETGDVIRSLVGNDFDLGNCVKALRRIYLSSIGQGKEGTDLAYDCNKVRYFIGEVERVNK